ncbi:GNAT family N-acetyltransferase [Micropruina sonneratiae]|uniref:GNAT family N-acetyltransferase n=1 Tax=Micropruina sonneratiae TaxID=2986940 RepID=UPI002226B827|nr:GNAT family N-acetyltransferase [Micropruina sp. KQZ13P-5]MCW3159353.1 GNAT family N-acetyltransferase [Micropruina sp. KQZ13P-5]
MHIVRRSLDHPDAVALCAAVQAEYEVLYGGSGDTSPMRVADFEPPAGSFLVGYVDGQAVASAAWRRLTPEVAASEAPTGEIKRVFVAAGHRGRGLSVLMMRALETDAFAAGIARLVLETGPMQPVAIELYRGLGYTDTHGGGWSIYQGKPQVVILEFMLPRAD